MSRYHVFFHEYENAFIQFFLDRHVDVSIKLSNKERGITADLSIYISGKNLSTSDTELLGEYQKEMMSSDSLPSIKTIKIKGNNMLIQLDQLPIINQLLNAVQDIEWKSPSNRQTISLWYANNFDEDDLSEYRNMLLVNVTKSLAEFSGYTVIMNDTAQHQLYYTSKSNSKATFLKDKMKLMCGCVCSGSSKSRETSMGVKEYIKIKEELLLHEMVERNKVNYETIHLLSEAVLKFNLLKVKSNSSVNLNTSTDGLNTSSDSVIFLLYNYSRLNAIIHEFESRIEKNEYPQLPKIEDIDFSFLKEKQEWIIIYEYIMRFPNLVDSIMKNTFNGKLTSHLLCQFLYSLSRITSSYYRRTKILLEPKPNLLKFTFARLYLVKAIHRVLSTGLKLLTIDVIPAL